MKLLPFQGDYCFLSIFPKALPLGYEVIALSGRRCLFTIPQGVAHNISMRPERAELLHDQGIALGVVIRGIPRPERAKALIRQHIPLIILNIVHSQKAQIFISKILFLMMFRLILDIIHHSIDLRLADGECAIASLPCKFLIFGRECLYPSAAIPFHLLHHMRHRFRLREHYQGMDVVLDTSNAQHLATCCIDKLTNIAMHSFQMLRFNRRAGGFRMEDDVQVDFT